MSKTIIVTGASRGIGKAISQKLLEEGYHILGIARNFDWQHPHLQPYSLDFKTPSLLEKKLKILQKETIDGIVCNAGKGRFGSIEEFSFQQMQELIHINLLSHLYLIKTFLPQLKKRRSGNIIFIGSEAALQGKRKGSLYCATKFALRGLAQALREECASDKIRISTIHPGMVNTDFFQDLHFFPGQNPSEHLLPEDIAHTVSWILKMRPEIVFDEIQLSPQKKRVLFKKHLSS